MKALTNDEFFKSLSDAEFDEADAIEAEIHKILEEGFSENNALKFVRTVMEARKAVPGSTVGGVYDTALRLGLSYLGDAGTLARLRGGASTDTTNGLKAKRKNKLSGKGTN